LIKRSRSNQKKQVKFMSNPKIVLWGTPSLAVAIAETLLTWTEITAIITTPDTPQGRKKILTPSPLKAFAQKNNIQVFNPTKLNTPETIELLNKLKSDIWLVIAYGKIIPQPILDIMPNKVLNIHPSRLPQYRGPSPIQASLSNGDKQTAVSLMQLDHLMDHGPIIAQEDISISPTDTYIELEQKIIYTSAKILSESLTKFIAGQIIPQPQDDIQASLVSIIQKQDGQINWEQHNAQDIVNLYRAYIIWPQIYTYLNNGKKVIFEQIELSPNNMNTKLKAGYWQYDNTQNKIIDGTNNSNIAINKLKIEGKNSIDAKSFANGYKDTYFVS
ncbi:MAG: methionyl-tRNA formyltransferase, partial [Candidatus Paceibacterota bacterium]